MNDGISQGPSDGDFVKYLEDIAQKSAIPETEQITEEALAKPLPINALPFRATIAAAYFDKVEPSAEELECLQVFSRDFDVSEEELARAALEDPGVDGNTNTPE